MKTFSYALAACFALLANSLAAQEPQPPAANEQPSKEQLLSSIDVKAFGAKGDGKTDDTDAIQKALNEAGRGSVNKRLHFSKGWYGGRNESSAPEIVFPSGTYLVSRTLVGPRYMFLRGEGSVEIRQASPELDLLYQPGVRGRIENLAFRGGAVQLQFWTNNVDASKFVVEGCRFYDAKAEALRCHSFRDPNEKPKLRPAHAQNALGNLTHSSAVPPYELSFEGKTPKLKPNDMRELVPYYNSTFVILRNCEFDSCMGVLNMCLDGLYVENCKVRLNPAMEGAAFRADGKCEFSKIDGYAPASTKSQLWFQSEGTTLAIRDSSFRSEKGLCLAKILRQKPPTHSGVTLTIEGCKTESAGCPEGAVACVETPVNVLSVVGNEELDGKPVKAVVWRTPANSKEDFDNARFFKKEATERQFLFCVAKNKGGIDESLDGAAKLFAQPYVPEGLLKAVALDDVVEIDAEKTLAEFPETVYAVKFGLVADGKTDDAEALQAAIDQAAKSGKAKVVLPGRQMLVSKTLRLPPRIALAGAGLSMLVGASQDFDLLYSEKPETLLLKNLGLVNARNGLKIVPGEKPAKAVVSGGILYDCEEWTVLCATPAGARNKLALLIQDDVIYGRISSDASYSALIANWQCMGLFIDKQAVMENRGGSMFVKSMLGVPISLKGNPIMKRQPKPQPETEHPWEYGEDQRWFDNYGKLHTVDLRYGGEGFGFSGVYNFSSEGTIFIEGAHASFMNPNSKKCQVYFEKPAKACVVYNLRGHPSANVPLPKMEGVKQSVLMAAPGVQVDPKSVFVSTTSTPPSN